MTKEYITYFLGVFTSVWKPAGTHKFFAKISGAVLNNMQQNDSKIVRQKSLLERVKVLHSWPEVKTQTFRLETQHSTLGEKV